ncbi:MAG: Xaa-Pro peptidase family protein [Pirellulaceae bacterium]
MTAEPMEPIQLSLQACRERQGRLAAELSKQDLTAAIFSSHENVQYFTGFRPHWMLQPLLLIDASGHSTLVAPNSIPNHFAADEVLVHEGQWHSTLRQDQLSSASNALRDFHGDFLGRVGVEASLAGNGVLVMLNITDLSRVVDIQPTIWTLRRRKDEDELLMIRRAVACTEAMYKKAREIIKPGISELDVYNSLHAAAVEIAGEPLTALGADYQCNSPGGPPRDRLAVAGELYILDLGPVYRGYWADNCRTFAVDGRPSDVQLAAWQAVISALDFVERTVRPGTSCRELFQDVQAMLDEHRPGAFGHHLGHGIGLFAHETPHLNPHWDDHFEEGDVFTAEPGVYYDALQAGIRLEQNYVVTRDGIERLTSFPLELA